MKLEARKMKLEARKMKLEARNSKVLNSIVRENQSEEGIPKSIALNIVKASMLL